MALREVYEYLYDNDLLQTDDFEFSQILAKHHANLAMLPSISYSCDDIIDEIKEDLHEYGKAEKVWVYFQSENEIYIPYDYLLENHDLLDEDDYYIITNLEQALKVFELLNEI